MSIMILHVPAEAACQLDGPRIAKNGDRLIANQGFGIVSNEIWRSWHISIPIAAEQLGSENYYIYIMN